MNLANQLDWTGQALLGSKAQTSSPFKTVRLSTITQSVEPRSPLQSKGKPKQPYLKRGTGLQNRLTAAKQKRYVPKGGFIKGQNESEPAVEQDLQPPNISSGHGSRSFQDSSRALSTPKGLSSPARSVAKAPELPLCQNGVMHRQHVAGQAWQRQSQQHNTQDAGSTHHMDNELDADTSLVHFPSSNADVARPSQTAFQQSHLQMSQQPSNVLHCGVSEHLQQSEPYSADDWHDHQADYAASALHAMPSPAGNWQSQQAAEVIDAHSQCSVNCL